MTDDTASFNMRLPRVLRERLGSMATAAGRSVNAEVVARLTRSLAGGHSRDVFEALQMPRVVRLHSTAPAADVDRLVTVCGELEADLVVFGARRSPLNGATMVAIVRTPALTCLMDDSTISLARRSRALDVVKMFKALDALGLLRTAQCFGEFVDDTSALEPAAAVDHLVRQARLSFDLSTYVAQLSAGQPIDGEDLLLGAVDLDATRILDAAARMGMIATRDPELRAAAMARGIGLDHPGATVLPPRR